MNRWGWRSLRVQAMVWSISALALLLLVSAVVTQRVVNRAVTNAFDQVLVEQAADRATLLDAGSDPASLVSVVGDEVVVVVFAADSSVAASRGAVDPTELGALVPGLHVAEVTLVDAEDGEVETESLHVAVAASVDGSRVAVGNELDTVESTSSAVATALAVSGVITAIAAMAAIGLLVSRALRPIFEMSGDLGYVVGSSGVGRVREPDTGDEVADLAVRLNGVLGQLEQQSAVRRRFVSDASHELKSPIANARALVETGGDERAVVNELDRLQYLVDDLLYLARTDETVPAVPARFDLDDVVFDECERAASLFDRELDAAGVQPSQVFADRDEIARAVRNLLENAMRYCRSRVEVSIKDRDGQWVVVVSDDGPGIPADQRDDVFERFVRVAEDRSRDDGGTGLGLSIVQSIAERNGGSVSVTDSELGGARFELRLDRPGD